MSTDILIRKFESFQPEIQREILDYIEYLEIKYKKILKTNKPKKWKQKFTPIKLKGKITASQLIIEERNSV